MKKYSLGIDYARTARARATALSGIAGPPPTGRACLCPPPPCLAAPQAAPATGMALRLTQRPGKHQWMLVTTWLARHSIFVLH